MESTALHESARSMALNAMAVECESIISLFLIVHLQDLFSAIDEVNGSY